MYRIFVIFFLLIAIKQSVSLPQQNIDEQKSKKIVHQQHQTQQPKQKQFNSNDQMVVATNIAPEKDSQYEPSSILENPAYDPNVYNSFIPQDAIQQYVNQFGGPYIPTYTAGAFPPPTPFAVQTGYEGYLVPDVQNSVQNNEPLYSGPLTFLKGIVPKFLVAWLIKSAAVLLSTFGLIFFGGAITTALCTLTPLCSISFSSLPALKWVNTAEAVGKAIGAEITPDRIRRTVDFVLNAIDKYSELQYLTQIDENPNQEYNLVKTIHEN